jgi:hypothetical protein
MLLQFPEMRLMRQWFFSEQMHIPTHPSTCATLKQLRHSRGNYVILGQVLLLSVRYEMSNSSYVAVQSMVKDKAGWYNDEPWEIVLRVNGSFENDRISAKWSFVFICCICFSAWQDIFLAIQAVRLLRTLRINRTRVNLVRLSRETCGNSCQVVRTFVDSGPFCQHSASILPAFSAWSFWHFGPVAISCWEGTPKLQCLIDPDRLSESLKHLQYPSVL